MRIASNFDQFYYINVFPLINSQGEEFFVDDPLEGIVMESIFGDDGCHCIQDKCSCCKTLSLPRLHVSKAGKRFYKYHFSVLRMFSGSKVRNFNFSIFTTASHL